MMNIFGINMIVFVSLLWVAGLVIALVYLIKYLDNQNAPMRTTVVQLFTVILILPLIFILAYLDKIGSEAIAAILGAIIGYLLGKIPVRGEWEEKSD